MKIQGILHPWDASLRCHFPSTIHGHMKPEDVLFSPHSKPEASPAWCWRSWKGPAPGRVRIASPWVNIHLTGKALLECQVLCLNHSWSCRARMEVKMPNWNLGAAAAYSLIVFTHWLITDPVPPFRKLRKGRHLFFQGRSTWRIASVSVLDDPCCRTQAFSNATRAPWQHHLAALLALASLA